MTAIDALRHIDAVGADVYVRPNGELLLRSRVAGEPVAKIAILLAQTQRDNIAAFGTEFCVREPKVRIRQLPDGDLILEARRG